MAKSSPKHYACFTETLCLLKCPTNTNTPIQLGFFSAEIQEQPVTECAGRPDLTNWANPIDILIFLRRKESSTFIFDSRLGDIPVAATSPQHRAGRNNVCSTPSPVPELQPFLHSS